MTGTPPSGPAVGADSQTVSLATVAAGPAVTTTKSASVGGTGALGDVVDYTVRVTNTGNVTLRSVVVNDPMAGLTPFAYTWPGEAGVLAPGAQVVARASHTITQADVDAGSIVNVATGSGLSPNGTPVNAASGTVTTPTAAGDPRLQVVKSGTLPAGATGVAGETITWSVSIRNTGNVTLSGVSASDSLPGISDLAYGPWPSGTAGLLAPGDAVTATATSTVRQTDVDAGAVSNAATATGVPARGQATTSVGSATVPLASAPALTIQKSGAYTAGTGSVGDTITYSYTVRNAGNVTLTGVAVSDPHGGLSAISYGAWASGTAGTLAPNQTITATATYQVRQSDVNAGSITDVATASGRPPTGAAVSATSQTVVLDTTTPAPAILTTKTASVGGSGQLGDLITYTLRATNSGNVTLTGVALSDPAPGLSPLAYGPWPGASGTLQPGESVTATTIHRITQADLDAGSVSNTATSTGTPPTGPAVTDPSDPVVTATAAQTPDIEVTKTGTLAGGSTARAGDTVAYSFSLRNTGNVTLTGVALVDLVPDVSPLVYSWPAAAGTLAPNQVVTATASYTLTQADIDGGGVDNVVSGSGTAPSGATITENDDVTVPIAPSASIDVSKTGTVLGDGEAGDQIRFDFVIVNDGNVTLTDVELADSIPGLVPTVTWPDAGAAGVLAPGATATATAVYEITQADVNSGSVKNSVTASGAPPSGADVTATDSVDVPTGAQRSELRLSKSGTTLPGEAGVGDEITYTFVLSNTGNVTVTGIVITDPLVGLSVIEADWPGAAGVLDPGQSVTATATLAITQAHIDAGRVLNTATASGTAPTGAVSTTSPQSIVPVDTAVPSVAVTNSGSLPPGSAAGSTVTWTYTLKNTGNVTLSGSALSDALAGTTSPVYQWNGPAGVLAPGATVTATATTVLTQADVDAGSIISLVTGRGTAPSGAVVTATAPATVTIASTAGLTLVKTASQDDDLSVGDIVTFTFDITNSGTATIDAIALSDPLPGLSAITFGPWPSTTGTLAPGTTVRASAQYTVTQADVDAGGVTNTAMLTGLTPSDATVSTSDTVELTTETRAPALELVKQDALSGDGVLGDSIAYSFTVRNTGNTTVNDIAIADELDGISGLVFGTWPSGVTGRLAPGQAVTATAQYTVGQADVDAGEVVNTATATGTTPTAVDVSSTDAEVTTDLAAADPQLTATKRGTLAAGSTGRAGDIVEYRFSVVNTGDVTVSEVAFDDALTGLSPLAITWPDAGRPGVLVPGAEATATATYVLLQSDVDAGAVSNAVTVTGTPVRGTLAPATAAATVTIAPGAVLSAVKSGVLAAGGIGVVGDTVEYTVVVTNTGNVTVTGGVLVDPMVGLYDVSIVWPDPGVPGRVGVGESVTGRGKYDLTQADVDAGFVENTASVAAFAPGGVRVAADTNTVRVNTVLPAAGLSVSKSGVASGSGAVGDVVSYEFGVTNTGNVTVSGVVLSDAVPGVVLSGVVWPDAGAPGVIAPGETATATGSYVISQADVDAGRVVNTASASGVPARSEPITVVSPESIVATVAAAPAVRVTDSGVLAPGATGKAGDVVTWTYVLTNDGNVTLSGATLVDALPGASAPVYVWPGAVGVLVPGQSVTATATYVLTQADVDAGSVTSLVTGTGTPPTGAQVAATTPATVSLVAAPGLVFTKTARLDAAGANDAGDGVTFDFRIENTGTVTLSGIAITDALVGIGPITVDWPATAGVLAPGQIARGTAPYDISQEDVDRGSVQNTASVRATTPAGEVLSTRSSIEPIPTADHAPSIRTVKGGSYVSGTGGVGSIIEYTFDITNTGNVTLRLIRLQDDLEGLGTPRLEFPSATGILPPGGTATGVARYTVTQADVDAGSITNVATSFGTSPRGVVVSDSSAPLTIATDAPTDPDEAIRATQSAELAAGDTGVLGDAVEYTFTIQNTGNTTLDGVALSNTVTDLTGFIYTWPDAANPGRLLPGQTVTITASHLVTQADVDAGTVRNTATGSGTTPAGVAVDSRTPATIVPLVGGTGSLDVTKTGTRLGDGSIGTQIRYDFVVTNTGTFSLSSVALTDSLDGLSDIAYGAWPVAQGSLAPGESVTATATYTLQQTDIDEGEVRNIASASALTPGGDPVTAESPESVITTIAAALAIDLEKSQVLAQGGTGRPGDLVEFAYTFTNTGNTTLRGVTLADGQAGLAGLDITWPGEVGVLAPGQSATATATYALTQMDVDAGRITSVAVASGDGGGTIVRDESSGETVITSAPALTLVKTAELTGAAQQGGGIRYEVKVTNTGNVTMSDVAITDDLAGLGAPTVSWPGTPGVLASGQSATMTADYVITAADVVRQYVENTASVVGTAPDGSTAEATESVRVEVPDAPSIHLDMDIEVKDGRQGFAGDTLVFRYTATNTGTTALTGVRITDPYPGLSAFTYVWPGEPGVLFPGQSVTATATVIITAAMEGTVVTSRAVVVSIEVESGVQVIDVASDALKLPRPAPTGLLPFTGGNDPLPLVGGSALLLLAGLVLMLAARRRRSSRVQNLSS